MKKNIKNEKVIRAITIGLATMIAATSTPVTVFADEAGEGGSEDYNDVENGVADDAQEASSSAESSGESASTATSDIPVVGLDGQTIINETGVDAATYSVNGIEVDKSAIATDLAAATTDLKDVDSQLIVMENTADTSALENQLEGLGAKVAGDIAAANGAITDGNNAVQSAADAENAKDANGKTVNDKATAAIEQAGVVESKATAAENLISEAESIAEKANDDINKPEGTSLQDQFDAATNSQEMSTVYNQMVAIVDKATADFQAKVEEYNTAKGEYENAQTSFENLLKEFVKAYCGESDTPESPKEGSYLAKIKAAISEFETAKGKYDIASGNYNTDSSDYTTLLNRINTQIRLYNGAAAKANSDIDDAISKLADAKIKADALKGYADAAYEKVNPGLVASAQAIEAAKKQLSEEKENATDSRIKELEENLFKSYVSSCYIPLNENGKVVEGGIEVEPQYDSNATPYYKVSYKAGEESKEIYLSFSIDADGNVQLSKIADEVVEANKALLAAKGSSEEAFTAFYYDKDGAKNFVIISETELAKKDSGAKEIKAADGKTVLVTGDGQFVVDGESVKSYSIDGEIVDAEGFVIPADKTTDLEIIKSTASDPEYKYDAVTGQVVKTITTDVTTTVYHEATLSGSDFDSKDKAKADLDQKIAALNEKDIKPTTDELADAITEGTEEVDKYSASGVYVSTFDAKISFETVFSQNLYQYGSDTLVTIEDGNGKVLVENFRLTGEVSSLEVTGANDSIIGSGNNMYCVVKQGEDANFYNTAHGGKDTITGVKVAKVTKKTVSVKTLGFENYGNPHKEYEFENWCKENGIALIGVPSFSGNGSNTKVTYYCVNGNAETISATASDEDTKNATTDEERKAAAKKALDEKAEAAGKTLFLGEKKGLNYESAGKISVGNGKYSYNVDYKAWDSTTTKKYVQKEAFNAEGINQFGFGDYSNVDVTNADTYALLKKYEDLKNKVDTTQEKVSDFQSKINSLNTEIVKLEKEKKTVESQIGDLPAWELDDSKPSDKMSSLYAKLKDLESKLKGLKEELESKEAGLSDAEGTLENLKEQLADDEEKLNDQLAREEEARRRSDGDDEGEGGTGTAGGEYYFAPTTTTGTLFATAPTTGVLGVRAARAGRAAGNGELTGDGELREVGGDVKQPVVKKEEKKVKKETKKVATTKIEDNKTPLAAAPEEQSHMSWWWLLLVALFGAGAYEAYKKHQEKKAEAEAVSESINKEEN